MKETDEDTKTYLQGWVRWLADESITMLWADGYIKFVHDYAGCDYDVGRLNLWDAE